MPVPPRAAPELGLARRAVDVPSQHEAPPRNKADMMVAAQNGTKIVATVQSTSRTEVVLINPSRHRRRPRDGRARRSQLVERLGREGGARRVRCGQRGRRLARRGAFSQRDRAARRAARRRPATPILFHSGGAAVTQKDAAQRVGGHGHGGVGVRRRGGCEPGAGAGPPASSSGVAAASGPAGPRPPGLRGLRGLSGSLLLHDVVLCLPWTRARANSERALGLSVASSLCCLPSRTSVRGSSLALRGQRLMSCSASVEEPHLEPVLGRERPRIGAVRLLTGENAIDADVRGPPAGPAPQAHVRPEAQTAPRGVPRVRRRRGAPASTPKAREAAPHHPWCA